MATIAGLASGVAHEINTPLSAILQAHQLVEMGLSPEEVLDQFKKRALEPMSMTSADQFCKVEIV